MLQRQVRGKKGIALVLTLFIMIILLIVTLALSSMAMTDNQISLKRIKSYKAFNLARSGLTRARAELQNNNEWGKSPVTHTYGNDGEDGQYTVQVALETQPNRPSYWKVNSVGQIGEYKRTVYSWVELESFSKYLYLTNSEIGNIGGRTYTIWFVEQDSLDGPVHSNGYFSISNHPKFAEKITSSNDGDSWYNANDNTYRGGITDPSKFYHYYASYTRDSPEPLDNSQEFSFGGGISNAEFPSNISDIKDNATVSYDKNIDYIRFYTVGSGADAVGYVDIKPQGTNQVDTHQVDNITIHVDGRIEDIYGTVKGRATVGSTKDVTIKKDILYNNMDSDLLGIVSDENIVLDTPRDMRKDITIYAALMAVNGSFYVNNYNRGSYRGTIHLNGSLVQSRRGPVGTFNRYGIATGYNKDYKYDQKLKFMRPPNFPHTGKFAIKSFRDKGALGGN